MRAASPPLSLCVCVYTSADISSSFYHVGHVGPALGQITIRVPERKQLHSGGQGSLSPDTKPNRGWTIDPCRIHQSSVRPSVNWTNSSKQTITYSDAARSRYLLTSFDLDIRVRCRDSHVLYILKEIPTNFYIQSGIAADIRAERGRFEALYI